MYNGAEREQQYSKVAEERGDAKQRLKPHNERLGTVLARVVGRGKDSSAVRLPEERC